MELKCDRTTREVVTELKKLIGDKEHTTEMIGETEKDIVYYAVLTYAFLTDLLNSPRKADVIFARKVLIKRNNELVKHLPKIKDMYWP